MYKFNHIQGRVYQVQNIIFQTQHLTAIGSYTSNNYYYTVAQWSYSRCNIAIHVRTQYISLNSVWNLARHFIWHLLKSWPTPKLCFNPNRPKFPIHHLTIYTFSPLPNNAQTLKWTTRVNTWFMLQYKRLHHGVGKTKYTMHWSIIVQLIPIGLRPFVA